MIRAFAVLALIGCLFPALASIEARELAFVRPAEQVSITPKKSLSEQIESMRFKNWGLANSVSGSHIRIKDAWKITRGSDDVRVAVIDTGIDPNHPDLRGNVWKKDGIFGWDFVKNAPNPVDTHGHGTHVAGIIGAMINARTGTSGVAHNVSIMPVKYYKDGAAGKVNLQNSVKALHWAIDNGAHIINYSGGGPEYDRAEEQAIVKACNKGILIVAAAGNEYRNTDRVQTNAKGQKIRTDENSYYPSAYGLDCIISVAATNIYDNLLPASNWGKLSVSVAAPGENIYSQLPGSNYGYMSGTSQATAFVSGLGALMLAERPNLAPSEIKRIIMRTVDRVPQLANKVAAGGRGQRLQSLACSLRRAEPDSTNKGKKTRTIRGF